MPQLDPRLVIVFCILFIVMGVFNIIVGRKRLLLAQARGQNIAWYKQVSILTGIEYSLLAVVLFINLGITTHIFSTQFSSTIMPVYILSLALSAVTLCTMLYWGIRGSREAKMVREGRLVLREAPAQRVSVEDEEDEAGMTPAQKTALALKRRERRQKAAAARRRRAGRA